MRSSFQTVQTNAKLRVILPCRCVCDSPLPHLEYGYFNEFALRMSCAKVKVVFRAGGKEGHAKDTEVLPSCNKPEIAPRQNAVHSCRSNIRNCSGLGPNGRQASTREIRLTHDAASWPTAPDEMCGLRWKFISLFPLICTLGSSQREHTPKETVR